MTAPSIYDIDYHQRALDGRLISLDADSRIIFKGGHVITGDGTATVADVVVRGSHIEAVGVDLEPAPDFREIDCRGKTVMPGMIDLHIHMLGTYSSRRAMAYLSPPGTRGLRSAYDAYLTLAYGFTTVRGLGHGDSDYTFALRRAIASGLVHGPRFYHTGWALAPTMTSQSTLSHDYFETIRWALWAWADGEEELRAMVRENVRDGANVTKINFPEAETLGNPAYTDAELRAVVQESHQQGVRIASHVKTNHGTRAAVMSGVDTIEHGPSEVDLDVLSLMRDRGTFLVPTLSVYDRILEVAEEVDYPSAAVDQVRRELDGRMENVRRARELGIRIGTGSDNGARGGFGYRSAKELELLVSVGFSPMEAVEAATGVAAAVLGVEDTLGTIASGMAAELLVLDGDPLQDITILQDPARIVYITQASELLDPDTMPHAGLVTGAAVGGSPSGF